MYHWDLQSTIKVIYIQTERNALEVSLEQQPMAKTCLLSAQNNSQLPTEVLQFNGRPNDKIAMSNLLKADVDGHSVAIGYGGSRREHSDYDARNSRTDDIQGGATWSPYPAAIRELLLVTPAMRLQVCGSPINSW
ncbi:hypothetical protein J6590_030702 [Homalodisca vitripennis]|nr:hypothetical protein J6590_030702 [Homalodisca vitripennis]